LLSKGLQVQAKFLHARSHRKQSIGGYKCNIEDRAPLSAVLRYAVMSEVGASSNEMGYVMELAPRRGKLTPPWSFLVEFTNIDRFGDTWTAA